MCAHLVSAWSIKRYSGRCVIPIRMSSAISHLRPSGGRLPPTPQSRIGLVCSLPLCLSHPSQTVDTTPSMASQPAVRNLYTGSLPGTSCKRSTSLPFVKKVWALILHATFAALTLLTLVNPTGNSGMIHQRVEETVPVLLYSMARSTSTSGRTCCEAVLFERMAPPERENRPERGGFP